MEVPSSTTIFHDEEQLIDEDWFKDDFSAWLAQYEKLEQSRKQDSQLDGEGSLKFEGAIKTEKQSDNEKGHMKRGEDDHHGQGFNEVKMQQPKRMQKQQSLL